MKIAFYTNFLTHHQLPFCLEMYKKYGNDFIFVSTEKINEERYLWVVLKISFVYFEAIFL